MLVSLLNRAMCYNLIITYRRRVNHLMSSDTSHWVKAVFGHLIIGSNNGGLNGFTCNHDSLVGIPPVIFTR